MNEEAEKGRLRQEIREQIRRYQLLREEWEFGPTGEDTDKIEFQLKQLEVEIWYLVHDYFEKYENERGGE